MASEIVNFGVIGESDGEVGRKMGARRSSVEQYWFFRPYES